ncbi:MAG: DUF2206 domain-containing protein [Dehalococcoidales bacterium]|nr:DUF2206 domain-containing protein [Dehalococcoidales bacterium]
MDTLKKIVLTVGLSIALLMFGGLLLNLTYPIVPAPLSPEPLLIAYNCSMLTLIFFAYWRNRRNSDSGLPIRGNIGFSGYTLNILIFSPLLPLLTIIGTYLMNVYQNNSVFMILIALIPLYIIALVIGRNKVSEQAFPIAIWMISLSLLLMRGLTSNHILGTDIFGEYHFVQIVTQNSHWDITSIVHNYDACLSVTILPVVYNAFLNINPEYVFKIIPVLIISTTPLVIYLISKTYLGHLQGFLCALLFMFQMSFIISILSATRSGIAILFFFLLTLVLTAQEIGGTRKAGLFLLLGASVIVSHYSAGYTLVLWIVILMPILIIIKLFTRKNDALGQSRENTFITGTISLLFFSFLFFWYGQVTGSPFTLGVNYFSETIQNLIHFGDIELRQDSIGKLAGIGIDSIPSLVNTISHYIVFLLITIGMLSFFLKFRNYLKNGFPLEFILSAFIFFAILLGLIIVPYVSTAYDTSRPFMTALVFLSPAFIFGGRFIAKIFRCSSWSHLILCAVLLFQYVNILYLPYHFSGKPISPYYEVSGPGRDQFYIYEQELASAQWFHAKGGHPSTIYGDWRAWTRLSLAAGPDITAFRVGFIDETIWENDFKVINLFTKKSMETGDYIYLRYTNVTNGLIYLDQQESQSIAEYDDIFSHANKLYTNGNSSVWQTN